MVSRIKNYRFDWKLSLFTALFTPVLLSLGFWQLEREQEKLELQSLYQSRQSAETTALSSVKTEEDLQYVPVKFRGHYDNEHTFLLDNKIFEGQVGYEVLSPFNTNEGQLVIVNRGWIAQNAYREILPRVDLISEEVELKASIYVPLGEQFMLGLEEGGDGWPRVIQSLDLASMSRAFSSSLEPFPYSVRLGPFEPGVYVRNWSVISTTPEKHRGYAIQWFTMTAVLLFLYFFVSTKKEGVITSRLEEKGEVRHG
jgi:surfeit locus 1 family protein